MKRSKVLIILCVFTLAVFAVAAYAADAAPLYSKNCATCHGENGAGKAAAGGKMKVPDLRSPEIQKMSDKEIFDSIAHGTKHKEYPHAFGHKGLSDEQIQALTAHVRSFGKKK